MRGCLAAWRYQGYPAASASTTQSSAGLQPRQLVSGGELALGDGRVARRREMVRMNSFLDRCITNANMRHEVAVSYPASLFG